MRRFGILAVAVATVITVGILALSLLVAMVLSG